VSCVASRRAAVRFCFTFMCDVRVRGRVAGGREDFRVGRRFLEYMYVYGIWYIILSILFNIHTPRKHPHAPD